MCTNVALVERLECYTQILVDSFEEFVTKSLIIITIAIGGVIAVLIYALKIINNRQAEANPTRYPLPFRTKKSSSHTSKCSRKCKNSALACSRSISQSDKSVTISPAPSYDEKPLSSVTLSDCCKLRSCSSSSRSLPKKESSSRLTMSSLPFRCPSCNRSSAFANVTAKKSCCSLCCEKDFRR